MCVPTGVHGQKCVWSRERSYSVCAIICPCTFFTFEALVGPTSKAFEIQKLAHCVRARAFSSPLSLLLVSSKEHEVNAWITESITFPFLPLMFSTLVFGFVVV